MSIMRSDCTNKSKCGECSYYRCLYYCHGCEQLNCFIRDKIYKKAMKLGDELFPADIIDFINDEKKLVNKMTDSEKHNLLVDIYRSCGFNISIEESRKYLIRQ